MNKNQQKVDDIVMLLSFEVSFEPIQVFDRSKKLQKISIEIRDLLADNPTEGLQKLLVLVEEYPNDPILAGYLANAYQYTNNEIMAEQTIIKNYQRFPNYLFARCLYAELCLKENRLSDAADAIDNKFNIKLLYPERSIFHVTEVVFFGSICVKYFSEIGDFDQAELQLDIIKELEDEHPAIKHLNNYMTGCLLKQICQAMNKDALKSKKRKKIIKKIQRKKL